VRPHWTNPPIPTSYAVAPDDFATIYDISLLYSSSLNGSGIDIIIPGQTELYNGGSDTTSFWSQYGISAKLVQTEVPNNPPSPAISPYGDLDESSLDTQWAGAVARGATIQFVYSSDVWDSAVYAVDNKMGQVLSISYGLCEQSIGLTLLPGYRQTVQMANSEGITFLAAAGDSGAVDCDDYNILGPPALDSVAEGGLAVDWPGSIPEVTSVGGTQLGAGAAYWNKAYITQCRTRGVAADHPRRRTGIDAGQTYRNGRHRDRRRGAAENRSGHPEAAGQRRLELDRSKGDG
jgi:subtilase family serine protease